MEKKRIRQTRRNLNRYKYCKNYAKNGLFKLVIEKGETIIISRIFKGRQRKNVNS